MPDINPISTSHVEGQPHLTDAVPKTNLLTNVLSKKFEDFEAAGAELVAEGTEEDLDEIQAAWKKTCDEMQTKMYLDAAREVGLPPSKSQLGQGGED